MRRPNLTVMTGTLVDVVLFEGKRATGVRALRMGAPLEIKARREVLLCANATASPGILERSGVGDPERLAALGIPLVHANPAVGESVNEHRGMYMQWRLNRPLSENLDFRGLRLVRSVLRYYLTRKGPMATAALSMRAAFRARPGANRPDTQVLFGMYSAELTSAMGKLPEKDHGFCALVYPLRPGSQGSIHIPSRDPAAPPTIEANYGSEPEDRRIVLDAVRIMRRFARQEPLGGLIAEEIHPGPERQSDEDILDFLDRNGMACLHAVGSCRMGRDAESVCDPQLRVRGVEGLRVCDTSVFPVIPAGNTNAPTMALAWRAAEVIRRDLNPPRHGEGDHEVVEGRGRRISPPYRGRALRHRPLHHAAHGPPPRAGEGFQRSPSTPAPASAPPASRPAAAWARNAARRAGSRPPPAPARPDCARSR